MQSNRNRQSETIIADVLLPTIHSFWGFTLVFPPVLMSKLNYQLKGMSCATEAHVGQLPWKSPRPPWWDPLPSRQGWSADKATHNWTTILISSIFSFHLLCLHCSFPSAYVLSLGFSFLPTNVLKSLTSRNAQFPLNAVSSASRSAIIPLNEFSGNVLILNHNKACLCTGHENVIWGIWTYFFHLLLTLYTCLLPSQLI